MRIEKIAQKINNFNGNKIITGELKDGSEVSLIYELPGLGEDELKDYSTGLTYKEGSFKSFKNFSGHYVYRDTKNHDARDGGKFLQGGQNIRR